MQNDQNKYFLVLLMVFEYFLESETSRKSRMQIMTSGANQNFDQKSTSVRNFGKIGFLLMYLLVFRCI